MRSSETIFDISLCKGELIFWNFVGKRAEYIRRTQTSFSEFLAQFKEVYRNASRERIDIRLGARLCGEYVEESWMLPRSPQVRHCSQRRVRKS